ncbi:MAG: hemolysin family protein [Solirubrobacteraceae bacterium]|nr:hemolysin family protein [Solirubrobacteraceae bacterium]
MSDGVAIALGIVLLLANGFFVGAEFAILSARRSEIEPRAEAGSRAARITLGAMEHVSLMLAGAQLGITICSLALGAIAEPALAHLVEPLFEAIGLPGAAVHPVAFVLALGVVVFLHVVIGEMVPKNLALAAPDRMALVLAPALVLVVRALRPVIALLNWIANCVLRGLGVEPRDEVTSAFTRDEVAGLVEESHREGLLEDGEGQLLLDALQFVERDARSVLLPLEDLQTLPVGVTLEAFEAMAAETGYSRFPVRDRDGTMVGYLHVKDLLREGIPRDAPLPLGLLRPMPTVRDADRLRTALRTMQQAAAHLARVEDAEGRTIGVVAMEDVLEELVGEIRDETSVA